MREAEKYNAEILKVAGFSMMMPLGRVIIQPTVVFNEFGLAAFLVYAPFALLVFLLGVRFVQRGYDILDEYGDINE